MKRIILSIILLCGSISFAHAQESSLDSIITYDKDLTKLQKEVFTYSGNGLSKNTILNRDGNIWTPFAEVNYTYDANGNLLSDIKTLNNNTSVYKNTFSYDSENNLLSEEFYINSGNNLIGVNKYNYVYNADLTIKEVTVSAWDNIKNTWYETQQYKYEYDNNLKPTLVEILTKDVIDLEWKKVSKVERSFDANGNLLEEATYSGENNAWTKNSKTIYTLNSNGILSKIRYINDGHNEWINLSKDEYTYTSNKLTSISELVWNSSTWNVIGKQDYTYPQSGDTIIIASTLQANNSWKPYHETRLSNQGGTITSEYYTVNENGSRVGIDKNILINNSIQKSSLEYKWDNQNGRWILSHQEDNTFNTNDQLVSLERRTNENIDYLRVEIEYNEDNLRSTEKRYSWLGNAWALENMIEYFYSDTITSIEENTNQPKIIIFSKHNKIFIESEDPLESVRIYTLTGQLIYNGSESEIDTYNWGGNTYIVSVTTHLKEHKTSKVLIY